MIDTKISIRINDFTKQLVQKKVSKEIKITSFRGIKNSGYEKYTIKYIYRGANLISSIMMNKKEDVINIERICDRIQEDIDLYNKMANNDEAREVIEYLGVMIGKKYPDNQIEIMTAAGIKGVHNNIVSFYVKLKGKYRLKADFKTIYNEMEQNFVPEHLSLKI